MRITYLQKYGIRDHGGSGRTSGRETAAIVARWVLKKRGVQVLAYTKEIGCRTFDEHSGGIIGGISTGQEIIFWVVVKPASSISVPQKTINIKGEDPQIRIEGRHACICPRIVPAMACLVIEDQFKRYAAMLD